MSDIELFREMELLWGMNDRELQLFESIATPQEYVENTIIFQEGDPSDELYVVVEGVVEIYTEIGVGHPQTLGELRSGSAFGEMALINDKPRSANAKAMEDSVLICVTRDDFLDLIDNHPAFSAKALVNLSRTLSNRLRTTNHILRQTMEWNVKSGGATELNLAGLIKDGRKVTMRLMGGEEVSGSLLKVEKSVLGQEITLQEEAGQIFIIPHYAIVYIRVEQDTTTLPLAWQ